MQNISLLVYKLDEKQFKLIKNETNSNKFLVVNYIEPDQFNLVEDTLILSVITFVGLLANLVSILLILTKKTSQKVINIFYLHHCFINLTKCLLFVPFLLAIFYQFQIDRGCNILSGGLCILITANVLNIVALCSCEAYRFEDLINTRVNIRLGSRNFNTNTSTASYSCAILGIVIIWSSALIIHLGITVIGSDTNDINKNFHVNSIRNCFFRIGDRQTYLLYLMWFLVNALFIILSVVYLKRIYHNISRMKHKQFRLLQKLPYFYQNPQVYLSYKFNSKNYNYSVYKLQCIKENNLKNRKHGLKDDRMFQLKLSDQLAHHVLFVSIYNETSKSFYSIKIPLRSDTRNKQYDLAKHILQNIRIQFIEIGLFVVCLFPLFFIIAIDSKFDLISFSVYRVLSMIVFSMPCLSPLCYVTFLVPNINKYCFRCFRAGNFKIIKIFPSNFFLFFFLS